VYKINKKYLNFEYHHSKIALTGLIFLKKCSILVLKVAKLTKKVAQNEKKEPILVTLPSIDHSPPPSRRLLRCFGQTFVLPLAPTNTVIPHLTTLFLDNDVVDYGKLIQQHFITIIFPLNDTFWWKMSKLKSLIW